MTTDRQNILVLGLPGAGKTTYLAAFWHVVSNRPPDASLRVAPMPDDREYLDELQQSWLQCRSPARNQIGDVRYQSLSMTGDFGDFQLSIPDLSGETFAQCVEYRTVEARFCELIAEASSVLLFVHPNITKQPAEIVEADALVDELGGDSTPDAPAHAKDTEWSPDQLPDAVKLVELLQIVQRLHGDRLVRIAVIVSAWDLVAPYRVTPDDWLSTHMPLLAQFVRSQPDYIFYKAFGVSAQGGNYSADVKSLTSLRDASQRVRVTDDAAGGSDIERPIIWLINDGQ